MVNKVNTLIFTILFIGILFGGLFQASSVTHQQGEMLGCSLMASSESICSMGAIEHLTTWTATFVSVTPVLFTLILLTILAGVVILIATVAPHILTKPIRTTPIQLLRVFIERTYSFTFRPMQELFSRGILHPKLF